MSYFETSPCCTEESPHTPHSEKPRIFVRKHSLTRSFCILLLEAHTLHSPAVVMKGGQMKTIAVFLINLPHLNLSPH